MTLLPKLAKLCLANKSDWGVALCSTRVVAVTHPPPLSLPPHPPPAPLVAEKGLGGGLQGAVSSGVVVVLVEVVVGNSTEEEAPAVVKALTRRARVPWLRDLRIASLLSLPTRLAPAARPPPPVGDTHTPFS